MKHHNVIAVIFSVLALSCTKVESDNQREGDFISFTVGRYGIATKAYAEYGAYESLDVFSSKAFLHAAGGFDASLYFDSAITWDGATWSPSRDYYWPKHPDSYINFVSWYANDGSADIVPAQATETSFKITEHTVGAEDRILVADEAWRQKNNTTTYYTTGVPTLFRHVLTMVKLNMGLTTDVDPNNSSVTYEVTLQSAKFEGVFQTGSLALVNTDPAATGTVRWVAPASATYLWTKKAGSEADVVICDADMALTTSMTEILAQRSFLPQELVSAIKLSLVYSVTTKSNGIVTSTESDIPASVVLRTIKNSSSVAITQWVPNKIYTYNIAINPVNGEILLEPTVESEWSLADSIDVTVE